jgi:D-sedoheptulose 7-phosphate isomerase
VDYSELVNDELRQAAANLAAFAAAQTAPLAAAARLVVQTLVTGGKVLACGNGGSAADAQHFAAELVGRFETERRPLPAVALTTDTSVLTAVGNDYGYDEVFSRQVRAVGEKGDLLLALSTSGNSTNVLRAVETARGLGLKVLALAGRDGGELAPAADVAVVVDTRRTCRIQECHAASLHTICRVVDEAFNTDKGVL